MLWVCLVANCLCHLEYELWHHNRAPWETKTPFTFSAPARLCFPFLNWPSFPSLRLVKPPLFFYDANTLADSLQQKKCTDPTFFSLFVCSAAVTIPSPSLPRITFPYICLTVVYFLSYCFLIIVFCAFLCLQITHHHHPLPPSHLFQWPRSMRLNASTLLPIISRTQLSDCPHLSDFCCLLSCSLA